MIKVDYHPRYGGSYVLTSTDDDGHRQVVAFEPDDLVRAVKMLAESYFAHEGLHVHDRAQQLAVEDYFATREAWRPR